MEIGQRVEYQTDIACYGIGIVVAVDDITEFVTVKDADDGSMWRGPMDLVTKAV